MKKCDPTFFTRLPRSMHASRALVFRDASTRKQVIDAALGVHMVMTRIYDLAVAIDLGENT